MSRKLVPLSILLVLCACADDTLAPSAERARFDHVTPPQPPTEITLNNYDVIFQYNGLETFYRGGSALFTGGLAYGTSENDVLVVNTGLGGFDITETGIPVWTQAPAPLADHQSATVLTEAPLPSPEPRSPVGIVTTRETFAWGASPDDDYVIVKYSLTNTTASTISGLHVGYMADPDFDDVVTADNDYVRNIAFYDAATQSARIRNTTPGSSAQHAIIILDRSVAAYAGWTNGAATNVFPNRDPRTNAEWWALVSGAMNTVQYGPADVRQYIGAAPMSIAPGATEVITFALVGGDNAADLTANIQAARAHALSLGGAREGVKVLVAAQPGLVQWTARLTFPSSAAAAAFVAGDARCGGAAINASIVSGSNVDVSFDALALDSRMRSGEAFHCAGRLGDGRYFAGTDYPVFDDGTIPVTRLTNYSGNDRGPTYSPDGSRIAFGSARGGIFTMPVTGDASGLVQLTFSLADQQPSWHPSGSDIVFARNGQILRVNVATKAVSALMGTGTNSTDPRYSPDGTRIAFRRGSQLWLMNADGTGAHQLAFGGTANLYPEWNVDGSRIYFTGIGRTSPASEGVYWINPNLGEPATAVTPTEASQFRYADLSADGTRLIFQNGNQLVFQDMQSGLHTIVKLPVLANAQPAQQNVEFSLDGKRVLFAASNGELYEFTIPVPATPAERAQQLTASVNQLVSDGLLAAGDGAQLNDKLAIVQQMIANGSMNAAINHVDAFINKVNALVNSRRLNVITGTQLSSDATLLIQQLEAAGA